MKKYLPVLLSLFLFLSAKSQMRQNHLDPGVFDKEIKKISFFSPTQCYLACKDYPNDGIALSTDTGRTWVKKYITSSNVNYNGFSVNITFGFIIKGVVAFSQDTVIAYGHYGLVPSILYTTNGGTSFLLVYHSQYDPQILSGGIQDMVFPGNGQIGYAVDYDRVLKTTNRGRNWSVIRSNSSDQLTNLFGSSPAQVVSFSTIENNPTFIKTSDGGTTWQSLPAPGNSILSGSFLSSSLGWFSVKENPNDSLRIYHTINGGSSWYRVNNALANPFSCYKMQFINDSTGFAIDTSFTTFKTTDTGRIWEPLYRDNTYSYQNFSHEELYANDQIVLAGGVMDFLEISNNAGGTPKPRARFLVDTTGAGNAVPVKLNSFSKRYYQHRWFVNSVEISSSLTASYNHSISHPVDTIKLYVNNGTLVDSMIRIIPFSSLPPPVLSSFSTKSGSTGTMITLNGDQLSNVYNITFGGVPATGFTILNNNIILATVGEGSSGNVMVFSPGGTSSLPGFTYYPVPTTAPPRIISFSPTSGPIGTQLMITGENFGTSSTQNVVRFGNTTAVVITATPTSITCAVPPGAAYTPISVTNIQSALSGQSANAFKVLFSDSAIVAKESFRIASTLYINATQSLKYARAADLDRDGKTDLVSIIWTGAADSLTVFRNTSSGSAINFAPRVNIGKGNALINDNYLIKEIDGDGKPDIVYLPDDDRNFRVLRNLSTTGSITFDTAIQIFSGLNTGLYNTTCLSSNDLNNDGRNDILLGNYTNNTVSLFRNTSVPGHISYAIPITLASGGNVQNLETGDIDNDGKNDLLILNNKNSTPHGFSFYRNTSTGSAISFSARTDITITGLVFQSPAIRLSDINNDSKPDIVISTNNHLIIYPNLSTPGNIILGTPFIQNDAGYMDLYIDNFSGDSKPDIISGTWANRKVKFFRNKTQGQTPSLERMVNLDNYGLPPAVLTCGGDFDNDGKTDIAVTGLDTEGKIVILKNHVGEDVQVDACQTGPAVIVADLDGTTFRWQRDSLGIFVPLQENQPAVYGTNQQTLYLSGIPASWNNYKFRCVVDDTLVSSVFRLNLNLTVPLPVITIQADSLVCRNGSVQVMATVTNAGSSPSYYWYVNQNNTFNGGPQYDLYTGFDSVYVKCIIVSSTICSGYMPTDTSNIIKIKTISSPPVVTITATTLSTCSGDPITFSATGQNAGEHPHYQWYKNGQPVGTDNPLFSISTLSNHDTIQAEITTTGSYCGMEFKDTSNQLIVTIGNAGAASVSISGPAAICQGVSASYTATAVNGGSAPSYQWRINGVNTGTNSASFSSSVLQQGDIVSVILVSNLTCATILRDTAFLTISVNPTVLPAVTISGTTTITNGQSTALTSTATNGGTSPLYQWGDSTSTHGWQILAGATLATLNYTPITTGDKVRCALQSNSNCASPNPVISNTLQFTVTTVTALNPQPSSRFGIRSYPNPVSDILYIDSLKISDHWNEMELLSVTGTVVKLPVVTSGRTSLTLDVSELPPGVYLLRLKRRLGPEAIIRFIKQ